MNLRKSARNLNRMVLPVTESPFVMKTYWFQYHAEAPKERARLHHHTFFEVHFILCGSVRYGFGDRSECTVTAGEWLLISPETPHIVLGTEENFRKVSLAFSFEDISENPLAASLAALFSSSPFHRGTDSPSFPRLFSEALRAAELPSPLSPYRVRDIAFALIDELTRFCGTLPVENDLLPSRDVRVARAQRYISDNIRRCFTVSDVAANVHLSEKQLCRIFRETEGENISDFIKREKLAEAKRLLCESSAPLREISESLGYSNEYNFIRFFKKAEGMTPGAFRKAAKG